MLTERGTQSCIERERWGKRASYKQECVCERERERVKERERERERERLAEAEAEGG